jgi:hypothetical protein
MPQLETLAIVFVFTVPNHVERQITHTPITAPVPLPNLQRFRFRGVSAYFQALVHWITTPRLENLKLEIDFFSQFAFSVPRSSQFMNTIENLGFDNAEIKFLIGRVYVGVYPHGKAGMYTFSINVTHCWHLDWQLSSVAQISNSLSQMFSAVKHLTLEHDVHSMSFEKHNRAEWRKLLRPFTNVKTLRIDNGLVEELSRCLQLEDGELPLGLLPELQELTYTGSSDTGDAFTSFIDARQNAGRPTTLVRRSPSPDSSSES